MLLSHNTLILNWSRDKGTVYCGTAEGLKNKARIATRSA